MAHIHLTTQEAARYALAAAGARFMPLSEVVDMAERILAADADDPAVRAYEEARDFEVRLAHERDEEAAHLEAAYEDRYSEDGAA